MYFAKISSSSAVHLPFFDPTFSQQGALPMGFVYVQKNAQIIRKQERHKANSVLTFYWLENTECGGEGEVHVM